MMLVALMPVGCVGEGDFSRFADMDSDSGWAYVDTIGFEVSRRDSLSCGDLNVAVRHNNEYPYANLWLEVSYIDGRKRHCDTVNLRLADVYGRWLGKGFGATHQAQIVVAGEIRPTVGSKICVRHIMRTDTLRGIDAVGVIFRTKE